ncbi:MAG: hypothetical protein KBC41_03270 [Candidatus Pacebacteria bacterium]|nr:hypothetical protein [Candidatus Paceibacterota bacterium]MBP9867068.1 hypothetical protein [Candidatus Paceibacterota bacterium]
MYKYLIVLIALMFIVSGGYYMNLAGGGMLGNIFTGNITTQDTLVPLVVEDIPGVYTCNSISTCKNLYTLILREDNTTELQITQKDSLNDSDTPEEIQIFSVTEKGVWHIDVKNILVITLTEKESENYDVPQKIVISNVRKKILSKISYTKSNYTDVSTMIFIKQE